MKRSRLLAAALLLCLATAAQADIVTEFGMGWKIEPTSYLLMPSCMRAQVVAPDWPTNPRPPPQTYSCGGDNPAFIGWPIAWQSAAKGQYGAYTVRAGWFHYSNWFDGGELQGVTSTGDRYETYANMLAATVTFNWSAWRRGR